MAVEKMKIVGVIGSKKDLDKAARLIVVNGNMHMLNAIAELNSSYLDMKEVKSNPDLMQELENIRPYDSLVDFSENEKIIKSFHEVLDIKPAIATGEIDTDFNYHDFMEELKQSYGEVKNAVEAIDRIKSKIALNETYIQNLNYARHEDFDIGTLLGMKYFDFEMMSLSREKYKRLKLNYENIPSMVVHLGVANDMDIIATLTPAELKEDAERIFSSLNILKLELPYGHNGDTEDIIKVLEQEIADLKREIQELKQSVGLRREKYEPLLIKAYTLLVLEEKIENVKSEVAIGESLFIMFGFVPTFLMEQFQENMSKAFDNDAIFLEEDVEKRNYGHSPPTKLKNNAFFRPFEMLIEMYGIPNYNEKDATPFFALSYMILFGAMFGDLGQGFVILLGGLLLKYVMKNVSFGGILSRMGISSMFFGLMYGSVFGNEEILHPLVISPMENINTILVAAVILGIILINIGYIYSLVNLYKRRDLEEGWFGREGVAGYLFFLTLILLIADKAVQLIGIPIFVYAMVLAAFLLLIVFKQPLAHKIKGKKKLYEDSATDYYVEAGFGIIETILSVVSNIVSFIRVGAFALNHVGLYVAFATIAEMMKSPTAGILVLIIGNVLIIGLEGLIVFIQSLRLEYYELFSKYYSGYGIPYRPIKLRINEE
jgi:V/A-type H+-transporting ATPase subunit I